MPMGATSNFKASESADTACFDALYQPPPGIITLAAIEDILIILGSFPLRNRGSAFRVTLASPNTLVSNWARALS